MEVPAVQPPSREERRWKRVAKAGVAVALLGLLVVAVLAGLNAGSPSALVVLLAQDFASVSLGAGLTALIAGLRHVSIVRPDLHRPVLFAIIVAGMVFAAHLYVINSPPTSQCTSSTKLGCVMDEVFYVPAAQAILSGEQCAPYADNCNLEHPPLAKALIASGIEVFGLNDLGWRIFNALLGSLSISLLFVLVYLLTGNRRLSYFSSFLFAMDTMFFVHSSVALIDVPAIFFTLLAFVLYFWKARFWRLDNVLVSGMLLGLALLSKETAVFAVATLFTYQLLFAEGGAKHVFKEAAKILLPAALVFFLGLQVYDTLFAASKVPTFVQQIEFVFKYGGGLVGGGWTDSVLGRAITPLDWLLYYSPVSYLVTTVTETVGSGVASTSLSYIGVGFYGVNNVIVLWLVFAWVPLAAHRLRRKQPEGAPRARDEHMILFMLVWFLWSYLPYIGLWAYGRVTYPFYMLPAVPSIATGAAYFTTREWFPPRMAWVYLLAAFVWFAWYFPLKDFLPVFVRAALGR
ncbi:MAG: glycosyltransferase family 39 protein [Nitrososphaerales archaeon]|nr:glycosyltransferase family 39 protein [Nitrososphaerales archaeon]